MDQEHSTQIDQRHQQCHHHHHHHSSERPRSNRIGPSVERERGRELPGTKNKWHLICIYRQIVNQLQQFLCPHLSVLPVSFGARGDRPYIHFISIPMQQQRIHTCRTRCCCCRCRCRALYSNDGNNHKNANIICHFLFQHATYHHPSAVKCYILKYKFNSYFL